MEPKENLIKQTIESIYGISQAKANPFLYDKIMHRMQSAGEQRITLRPSVIRLALAFAVILIGLNVFSLISYNRSESKQSVSVSSVNSEYFSYLNNY